MAKLKLMVERLSEKEKTSIQNDITKAERQAELEVKRAQEEAEEKLALEKEKIIKNLEYRYSMLQNTESVNYRNAILKEKQKVIQKTFKDATDKLSNISSEEFMDIVMNALSNVDVTQRVEILLGERTAHLMNHKALNEALPWNNHVNVKDETVRNKSGLLVRMNNVDYNYFFDELIEENKNEFLEFITNELFEGE